MHKWGISQVCILGFWGKKFWGHQIVAFIAQSRWDLRMYFLMKDVYIDEM